MAGDWIKMELGLPRKPEVIRVGRKLGMSPESVVGWLLKLKSRKSVVKAIFAGGWASRLHPAVDPLVGPARHQFQRIVGRLFFEECGP